MPRKKDPEKEEIEKRIQKEIEKQQMIELNTLIDSVAGVTVIPGLIYSDPDIWRISVGGKTIEIKTSKLDNAAAFRQQYIKVFRRAAPGVIGKKWFGFLEYLGSIAADGTQEENTEMFVVGEILTRISKMDSTTDRDIWVDNPQAYFFIENGVVNVHTDTIKEMLTDINMKCDIGRLGQIMIQNDLKLQKPHKISVYGIKHRVWRLFPKTINEYRDKPLDMGGDINE